MDNNVIYYGKAPLERRLDKLEKEVKELTQQGGGRIV